MDNLKLHIEVTEQDISKGKRGNCWEGPISLAFNRALKKAGFSSKGVFIQGVSGHFVANNAHWYVRLPIEATQFIIIYDGIKLAEKVQPFAFNVECQAKVIT